VSIDEAPSHLGSDRADPLAAGFDQREPRTRNETVGLVLATVASFAVATVLMRDREFWLDESFSYLAAQLSIGDLASFALDRSGELNMALYYLALKPFAAVSTEPLWLRLPSLIPTVATVVFVWLIADRVSGRRFVRVTAVLVFLAHPLVVDYAFEARAYGMLFAATSGLTLLLLLALDGSRAARWAYVVLLPLLVALHLLIVFVIIAHTAAIALANPGSWRQRAGRTLSLTSPGLVVAAVAGLTVFRHQGTLVNNEGLTPWSFGSAVYAVTGRAGPLTFLVLAAIAVAAVTIVGARDRRPLAMVLLVTSVVPPVLALAASIQRPVFTPRYLSNLVPLLACLVAIGIAAAFADRRWRVAAVAVVVALGFVGQAFIYRDPSHETPGAASAFILERSQAGDIIVFNSPFAQLPHQYLLDATGASGPTQAGFIADPRMPTSLIEVAPLEPLVAALPAGASVWVVENRPTPDGTAELTADLAIDGGLERVSRTEFGAVAVERWTNPS